MKRIKHLLGVILAVALLCSAMSISASAACAIDDVRTSFTSASGSNYYVYYGSGDAKYNYRVGYGYITSGKLVKLAQVRLVWGSWFNSNNSYSQQVDGGFGSNTYAAVVNYQNAFGLSADGVVGANTWKSMLYYTYRDYPTSFPNLLTTNSYL